MADERDEQETPRRTKPRRARPAKSSARRKDAEPLSGAKLVASAREQLGEITGMQAGTVTSLEPTDDDGWKLSVELVELSRIPKAADILGMYEVTLDSSGNLLGYRRLRRYSRGDTGGVDRV